MITRELLIELLEGALVALKQHDPSPKAARPDSLTEYLSVQPEVATRGVMMDEGNMLTVINHDLLKMDSSHA